VNRDTPPAPTRSGIFHLSPGEIHFLWWFTQGMMMCADVREKLHEAWGLCERHAWGWLSTEAAFCQGFLLRPAIVYEDLMERTVAAFDVRRPLQSKRLRKSLKERGACFVCESGFGPDTSGIVKPELVATGGNISEFRSLAHRTRPYWQRSICGRCSGSSSPVRCRKHFVEESDHNTVRDFDLHKELVTVTLDRLVRYCRSFRWGFHDTRTDEEEAALIVGVGWCSGWRTLLSILGQ